MKRIGLLLFIVLYFSFSAFGAYTGEDLTSLFKTNDMQVSAYNYLDLIKIVCENTRETILNVGKFIKVVKADKQSNKTDAPVPASEKKAQSQVTLVPQYKLLEFNNFNNLAQQTYNQWIYYTGSGGPTKLLLLFAFCIFLFLYRLKLHRSRARGALVIVVNFLNKINPVLMRNQSGVFLLIINKFARCSNV